MAHNADYNTSKFLTHPIQPHTSADGISLYVHFPFCSKLCGYCDFHKEILDRRKEKVFFEALTLAAIENGLLVGKGRTGVHIKTGCIHDGKFTKALASESPFGISH